MRYSEHEDRIPRQARAMANFEQLDAYTPLGLSPQASPRQTAGTTSTGATGTAAATSAGPGTGAMPDAIGGTLNPTAGWSVVSEVPTAEAKLQIIDRAVEETRAKILAHEQALITTKNQQESISAIVGDMSNQITNLDQSLGVTNNRFSEDATRFTLKFVYEQQQLHEVKERVQREFDAVKAQMQKDYKEIKSAVLQVQDQARADQPRLISETTKELDGIKMHVQHNQQPNLPNEERATRGSIIPMKELKSSTCDGGDKWRQWIDEVKDYAEVAHPHARAVLEKIQKLSKEDADDFWVMKQDETAAMNP